MPNHLIHGFRCFLDGVRLALSPSLRAFILMPLAINAVLFALLTWWVLGQFDGWIAGIVSFLPQWLVEISRGVIAVFLGVLLVITMGVSFLPLTSLIAAPFNGLLAERAQLLVTGVKPPDENLVSLVLRSLLRELRKLAYFFPRSAGVLLLVFFLSFIPLLNLLAPVIGFLWGAWFMTLQHVDYCEDNQQRGFQNTLALMRNHRWHSYGFGGAVMLAAMVPVLNWFVIPVAVCGAVQLWAVALRSGAGQS